MNSVKKYVHILWITVVLLLAAVGTEAAQGGYVNDEGNALGGLFTDAWAIGADGPAQLSSNQVWALTANGLEALSGATGGGGLLYDDGSVRVAADTIRVGLRYYYSEKRDTSMEAAYLENAAGSGYAFGYYDANRRFVQFDENAVTGETQLTIKPLGDTALGVYSTATGELLRYVESSGRQSYLAIHPLSWDGEAVTWFARNKYYGDFAYADLGNGKVTVVNVVDVEHYVMGVCAGEMGGSFPLEALKAQAVAARTYAMFSLHGGGYGSALGFDLTADDYSQVYLGYTDTPALVSAALETENQYLTYDGKIIESLFCAADGGSTLDSEEAFSNAVPYLRGYPDPYEASAWTNGPFGHRVGMSQWGAYAMAKYYDKNYKDILGFYYTGVGLSYGYIA